MAFSSQWQGSDKVISGQKGAAWVPIAVSGRYSGVWATNHSGARGGRWCIRTLVRDGQVGNSGLLEILRLGDFREILRSPNHQLARFEAEIFNPDGSTFKTTITQKLNPPKASRRR